MDSLITRPQSTQIQPDTAQHAESPSLTTIHW